MYTGSPRQKDAAGELREILTSLELGRQKGALALEGEAQATAFINAFNDSERAGYRRFLRESGLAEVWEEEYKGRSHLVTRVGI